MIYFDNDDYERDKYDAIKYCESKNLKMTAELLSQSKWIKAYPTIKDLENATLEAYDTGFVDGDGDGFRRGRGI